MKWLVSMALSCSAVFAAGPPPADVKETGPGVVEEIVAKVNGDIVTRTELERGRRQLIEELTKQGAKGVALQQEVKKREPDILRARIDEMLLVQKGKELSISVDNEVNKYLAEIQKQSGIAEIDKFQQFIRDNLGMLYEDYKAEIKNQYLRQRVLGQEVFSRVQIPRADLQKYYEEHKGEFVRQEQAFLREIFISTEGKDAAGKAAAEKKAKDLVARARKGEKFFELARDNSDSVTAKSGGDLGGYKPGEMSKDLDQIVFGHDRGYVTDPIPRMPPSPQGFLILKVEEKFKAGQASFEDVENEVREKVAAPKTEPAIREYLTKLRENAFLEIKEGYVDSGAAPGKDTAWKDPATLRPETVKKEEVASRTRHKRLLKLIPVPGTTSKSSGTSSSR
jgi:peptidyl-prolyl cis-trans isomerase SurA